MSGDAVERAKTRLLADAPYQPAWLREEIAILMSALERPARIVLVDGEAQTALSAEALVVALFASGLMLHKNPPGQLVGITVDHAKVITLATALQEQLDRGETLKLERGRIARPGLA